MPDRKTAKVHRRATSRARQGGFSLIEVLAAFAIASVSLIAIYQALSSGMRATEKANELTHLALEARSRMAEVSRSILLEPTSSDKKILGATVWTLRYEPVDSLGQFSVSGTAAQLYQVELTGTTKAGVAFKFRSYKLVRKKRR